MSRYFDTVRSSGELFLSRRVEAPLVRQAVSTVASIPLASVHVQDYDQAQLMPASGTVALAVLVDVPGGDYPARLDVAIRDRPWGLDVARQLARMLDVEIVTRDGPSDRPFLLRPNLEPIPVDLDPEVHWRDQVVLTPESRAKVDAMAAVA